METLKLLETIKDSQVFNEIYFDKEYAFLRIQEAIEKFQMHFGGIAIDHVFSVPGRTEIAGNHTDHNHGKVLCASVDRDVLAVLAKTSKHEIRILSEGHPEIVVNLDALQNYNIQKGTTESLVLGTLLLYQKYAKIEGGFVAYLTSSVPIGSGLSSSAAFENMLGYIVNTLYCNGSISNVEIAKNSQIVENQYYGKPCGLMDQMASSVGGLLYIDFMDNSNPVVESTEFPLAKYGYSMVIVNTGGNHVNLTNDYASIPGEMKSIARYFGKEYLSEVSLLDFTENARKLRKEFGDRAVLRAYHFFMENERVISMYQAVLRNDLKGFLALSCESGKSSALYLQNNYSVQDVKEQGIPFALAMTEFFLKEHGMEDSMAYRVHGGGFAGTIQVILPTKLVEQYCQFMDGFFYPGSASLLQIRPYGCAKIL